MLLGPGVRREDDSHARACLEIWEHKNTDHLQVWRPRSCRYAGLPVRVCALSCPIVFCIELEKKIACNPVPTALRIFAARWRLPICPPV